MLRQSVPVLLRGSAARSGLRPLILGCPTTISRCNSTAAAAAAADAASTTAAAAATPIDPKINEIVQSISKLTLLETSQLISELKKQLNIPDMPMAPMGAMGGLANGNAGAGVVGGAGAGAEEETAAPKEEEKTTFTVKLESFETKGKAKIIKEVKSLLGLSLVEAKKFVEGAPKVLKENVNKEDADKMKDTIEKLGGKISLD